MKKRCTYEKHPHFDRYRKLGLCHEWSVSFEAFLACVGRAPTPDHSLERINTAKGYFPGNVGWATPKEQSNNRSDNLMVEIGGETLGAADVCRRYGIKRSTLNERIKRG